MTLVAFRRLLGEMGFAYYMVALRVCFKVKSTLGSGVSTAFSGAGGVRASEGPRMKQFLLDGRLHFVLDLRTWGVGSCLVPCVLYCWHVGWFDVFASSYP